MGKIKESTLLPATIATATGGTVRPHNRPMSFTAEGETSSGAGTATIIIEGKAESGTVWETIDTLSLTLGTTTTSDSGSTDVPWSNVRARLTTLTGTGATVRSYLNCEANY